MDGFRVDAVPHLFETNYTVDEPKSNIKDVSEDDYNYLIHTLTKDQPQTYDLVQSWRKILDDYALNSNTDEKVTFAFNIIYINVFKYKNIFKFKSVIISFLEN